MLKDEDQASCHLSEAREAGVWLAGADASSFGDVLSFGKQSNGPGE
jgi:hypothetical protein